MKLHGQCSICKDSNTPTNNCTHAGESIRTLVNTCTGGDTRTDHITRTDNTTCKLDATCTLVATRTGGAICIDSDTPTDSTDTVE